MESGNKLVISENACHDFKFSWTIPNFKTIPGGKLNAALPTPVKCSLKLELIMKVTSGSPRKLKIGLSKTLLEPQDLYVFFHFEFCNFRGEIFSQDSLEFLFSRNEQEIFSREIAKPSSAAVGPNGARHPHHISVRGHVVVKQCCERVEVDAESKDEAVSQLQQDFMDSLQSGEAADVTLEVGEEEFRVNKFVICTRSPVFKTMFTNDMSENRLNRIRIKDMNSAVLKDFLTFLYTGDIGTLAFDEAYELYSVGDKYEVLTLQSSCRNILISCLSDNTVSRILKLADMHIDKELEDKAVDFICKNFTAVAENSDWKTLIFDSPSLVSRTLTKVSYNMSVLQ